MKLEHISDTVCKHCGAEPKTMFKAVDYESVGFTCGHEVSWNRQENKVFTTYRCKKDPEYEKIVRQNEKALKQLNRFVSTLDLDDFTRKCLLRHIEGELT